MKRVAVISTVVLAALNAHGKDEKKPSDELCASVSTTAAEIMKARQNGVAMSKLIEIFKKDDAAIFRRLTISAYESPRYSTESMQEKSIQDFENKAFLDCYKATNTK